MDTSLIELYANLKSETDIRTTFISPKHGETNHVEFKEKADNRIPDLGKDDKRHFAKGLSAFSNSDGGLLVWGIRTRRKDERDFAFCLKPIKQVDVMAERMRTYLIDAIMPQNPEVRIEAIRNRLGNGYVKCLIPESPMVPHRSMVDREYWVRLDGRSVRLEHYLIRDMMLRNANPDLTLNISSVKIINPLAHVRLAFTLENTGRAIAKHAGWHAAIENATIVSAEGCRNLSELNDGKAIASWEQEYGNVIHPAGLKIRTGLIQLIADNRALPILIHVKYYCEGMAARSSSFSVVVNNDQSRVSPLGT